MRHCVRGFGRWFCPSRSPLVSGFCPVATRRWASAADTIPVTSPFEARRLDARELKELLKAGNYPRERIRNFSIIAHVDHGKTTLSDAILKRTKVVEDADMAGTGNAAVYMDKLAVERERGITVKAQTASIFVRHPETKIEYLLNLIDTPGHIDFAYEVQRSLVASEGAVLLIDATQGVQAQTMANYYLALNSGITMIPALTKCDATLEEERLDSVALAVADATGFLPDEVMRTSARQAKGLEALLRRVLDDVEPPSGAPDKPLRAYLFDAYFGRHKRPIVRPGHDNLFENATTVLCNIRIVDGTMKVGDIVTLMHAEQRKEYRVMDCGVLHPEPVSTGILYAGMVGFVDLGMQSRREANVGDTLCNPGKRKEITPVAEFKSQRPIIFATFHPNEGESFDSMRHAIDRLCINDPSVTVSLVRCPAFGPGLQLGFFGTLHQSVFEDRLSSEFDLDVLVTPAQVFYKYQDKAGGMHSLHAGDWVDQNTSNVAELLEPVVTATIVCRETDFAALNKEAVANFRGEALDLQNLDGGRVVAKYRMPLAELIRGLMERVMAISHGFATLEYDEPEYIPADLVKIDVLVNKKQIPALATIAPKQDAQAVAKRLVTGLKEHIKEAIVTMPVQAAVGGKVIARETVSARKKDVLSKIHAGDYSRKAKKLADQKKGKSKIASRMLGQFSLDSETLAAVMGASKL